MGGPRPRYKKKRKCPICGKYRVKLKSDMPDDAENPSERPGTEADPGKNNRTPLGEGENTPEKAGEKEEITGEEEGGGWLVLAALLVLTIMPARFSGLLFVRNSITLALFRDATRDQ